ncbi:hypothetical protein Dimus_031136 [Dionaea muscipula]
MVGRRGWPKGRPRKVVVRSAVGLVGQGAVKGGVGGQVSPNSGPTLDLVKDGIRGHESSDLGKSLGGGGSSHVVEGDVLGGNQAVIGDDLVKDGIRGRESSDLGKSLGGGGSESPESGNRVLGETSQGGLVRDLVREDQVEGSCAVSWAEECELISLVHNSSPVKLKGDFLSALTQSASMEVVQSSEAQAQVLEGNRALCNGLRLWGHKGEDCRAPKQQRKEWRSVLKVPGVCPPADRGEGGGSREAAQGRDRVDSVRDVFAAPVGGEAGRLGEEWQVVKGASSSHCLPVPSPVLVSASRFSPLDPGNGGVSAEQLVGDMLGGILVPARDVVT